MCLSIAIEGGYCRLYLLAVSIDGCIYTMTEIRLRRLEPTDGKALEKLFSFSPDGGQFSISPRYQIDPYQVLITLAPDSAGVVAELSDTGEIVGVGFVQIENRLLAGVLTPCAALHSLTVHPSYRRQGVATRLAQWRVAYAREQMGEEGAMLTFIQKGNSGSLATAEKWGGVRGQHIRNSLIRTRQKLPTAVNGLTVRKAEPAEYGQIATSLNTFYTDYDLYTPHTAENLTVWLEETPFKRLFRHYYVAVDSQNNLLAGVAVAEQFRMVTMHVQNMPAPVRLLNKLVKMVPPDGILRQLSTSKIWHAPDQLAAAQFLWESMRWQWRTTGSHLLHSYDSRSPVAKIISPPFWMPNGAAVIVGDMNVEMGERLVCVS